MRELAQFWLDELVIDPRDGTLVVSPSYSPEHGDFSAGAFDPGVLHHAMTGLAAYAPWLVLELIFLGDPESVRRLT